MFEFDPIPENINATFGEAQSAIRYIPNFVAVDGSGASLSLAPDPDWLQYLYYDKTDNEIINDFDNVDQGQGTETGYTPASDGFGLELDYYLSTKDGTQYEINSATGQIETVVDKSGNTTIYSESSDGTTITGTLYGGVYIAPNGDFDDFSSSGQVVLTITKNTDGEIESIAVPGENSIHYNYDDSGNLISVQNQTGNETFYSYQDPNNSHLLTGVTNADGETILGAQYNAATGDLDSLITANGTMVPISAIGIGSDQAVQTVVDAAGDITQDVFDETYGNLVRKIQLATDSSGNLYYVVTASSYSYVTDDVGEMSALRPRGSIFFKR